MKILSQIQLSITLGFSSPSLSKPRSDLAILRRKSGDPLGSARRSHEQDLQRSKSPEELSRVGQTTIWPTVSFVFGFHSLNLEELTRIILWNVFFCRAIWLSGAFFPLDAVNSDSVTT